MGSRTLTVLALLVLGAGLVVIGALERSNAQFSTEVAILRRSAPQGSIPSLPARTPAPPRGDDSDIRTNIDAVRKQIAALEQLAASGDKNRDPTKGLTAIEYLQPAGQDTPAAAVQTLVWAALTGHDTALIQAIALNDSARAKAQKFLAGLPEAERAKYPTPESFAALFLSLGLLKVSAIQIMETTPIDSQTMSVRVLGLMNSDQKLQMHRSSVGWQFVVGDKQIDWAIQQVSGGGEKKHHP